MAFQPADTLKSRTFIGLLLAQFLAAFNDQAIHASAMFFAIHKHALTEKNAITLMPILFFAPWALFCTVAGYLADRYSKRNSLVIWKIAEIAITLVALVGFGLGKQHPYLGPAIVLSTVFLMGTHSAFFVPAKYGVMPEILQPHLLSKGNGYLESTSFLAVILGTVSGGFLSFFFREKEYFIGLILVTLAVIGAVCSMLIRTMPAANPNRPFPRNLFKPLYDNLRTLLKSRPLALAVLGIAFFTFMVAFMRATMYMHGESQNPRWDEFQTSLVVATVALGVGIGSPVAGRASGGKVELGLVPLGAVGMIFATLLAAVYIFHPLGLVIGLVLIGFFSGFYIVPLYTLLQHRAPKASKGDLIATSNFINVTGAIAASLLFKLLVTATSWVGIDKRVPTEDIAHGTLVALEPTKGGRPGFLRVQKDNHKFFTRPKSDKAEDDNPENAGPALPGTGTAHREIINGADGILVDEHPEVIVSTYGIRGADHFEVRPADSPPLEVYDKELVPRYLFVGASIMTLGILILLCRQLPDFFVRALLWIRSYGRYRLKVVGLNNLPSDGPVILATNCDRFEESMQVVAATDRFTRFILLESVADEAPRPLLRYLANRTGTVVLRPPVTDPVTWDKAMTKAIKTLDSGCLLGVTAESSEFAPEAEKFLRELRERHPVPILPVYCGVHVPATGVTAQTFTIQRVQVVIGHPLPGDTTPSEVRLEIRRLGDWIRQTTHAGLNAATVMIPRASSASPTKPGADLPTRP
jgi:MFS family permease